MVLCRYLIQQHPAVEAKLAAELDEAGLLVTAQRPLPRAMEYADLGRLTYLNWVCKVWIHPQDFVPLLAILEIFMFAMALLLLGIPLMQSAFHGNVNTTTVTSLLLLVTTIYTLQSFVLTFPLWSKPAAECRPHNAALTALMQHTEPIKWRLSCAVLGALEHLGRHRITSAWISKARLCLCTIGLFSIASP